MSSDIKDPIDNGVFKAVMSSAAEAELGASPLHQLTWAVSQRQTLEEMGHKQPPTPMQTDNTTALGIVNNNIQPRCNKAMHM